MQESFTGSEPVAGPQSQALAPGDCLRLWKRWRKRFGPALLTAVAVYLVPTSTAFAGMWRGETTISYWPAGQFLIHGGDPYDWEKVLELEWQQGYAADRPVVVRNPPWSLFLFPLGLVSAFWGWVLWTAALVAALVASVRLTWKTIGKTPESRSL